MRKEDRERLALWKLQDETPEYKHKGHSFGKGRFIYRLIDPRDGAVRYIGIAFNPIERLRQHIYTRKQPMKAWMDDLKTNGLVPTMECIEQTTGGMAKVRERHYIKHYQSQNANLLNIRCVESDLCDGSRD